MLLFFQSPCFFIYSNVNTCISDRNNPPAINNLPSSLLLPEDTSPMTSIFSFMVTDSDVIDSLSCLIDVQPTSGYSLFTFNSTCEFTVLRSKYEYIKKHDKSVIIIQNHVSDVINRHLIALL